jgi:hypothetical protein
MGAKAGRLSLVAGFFVVAGCSAMLGEPFDPSLEGRQYYLCCNMSFNPDFAASDANYGKYVYQRAYSAGPTLAAGTRVTVVKVGGSGVQFKPENSDSVYLLGFHYGKKQLSAKQYFANILRDSNPMDSQKDASRRMGIAISMGRLTKGMTREQALLTRGYPPAHRTPDLNADEWIYYDTPGFVDRVVFKDGVIESITRDDAPP